MALFDSVIGEMEERFGLTTEKAGGLLAALLGLISDPKSGGFGGFVDRFDSAGLGDTARSWITAGDNTPLSNEQLESALGEGTITSVAGRSGVDRETAATALAGMVPRVVDDLTPDGDIPDESSLMSKIGGFLADWGGTAAGVAAGVTGTAREFSGEVVDRVDPAAESLYEMEEHARKSAGVVGDRLDAAAGGSVGGDSGRVMRWLLPLIILALLVILGLWFCGKQATPTLPMNVNANTNRAISNSANPVAESSFRIAAKDGKYVVSGIVPDAKTLGEIKAGLDAQFGVGKVDYTGLKVDANAQPFRAGWWDNFSKLLPSLKDWKNGTLAFTSTSVTDASGLPAAALAQLRSLFTGWALPSGTATEPAKALGEVVLPNGTKLQAYPGGIEDQLVKFIGSDEYKNATAETLKDKWFNFDDLNFVFGKTELTPESKRQLDNIVAILKAYPDVKIKIGGYTDKKGDDAANLKLSDSRAKAVQAALQKEGVGPQVPEAEGYGEKFAAVNENASDEERKADRKTAIRLIK